MQRPSPPSPSAPFALQQWLGAGLAAKMLDLVAALAIALVGWWLARRLSTVLDRVLGRLQVDDILRSFLRNLAFVVMMVVVGIAALQQFGIPTTSLLALVGAAGLAIGLALKDSLSNIASGVMLIMLRPFRAGDSAKAGGVEGVVEQVRIFTTFLRTYQNELIVLPNSEITKQAIVNLTHKPVRRIDIALAIDHDERIDRTRGIILAIAAGHPSVLKTPEPVVLVSELGRNGVELSFRCWCRTADLATTRSDLAEALHVAFTEAGISRPDAQRLLPVVLQAQDLTTSSTRADNPA